MQADLKQEHSVATSEKITRQEMIARRRKARHYALQALYQWQMAGADLNVIEAEFRADYDFSKVDLEYFQDLLHQVPKNVDLLDQALTPLMEDRSVDELGPIERALLRMSMYELMQRLDVPYKVVINEAVALAKKFGATDSHKFVNGVLDNATPFYRSIELSASS